MAREASDQKVLLRVLSKLGVVSQKAPKAAASAASAAAPAPAAVAAPAALAAAAAAAAAASAAAYSRHRCGRNDTEGVWAPAGRGQWIRVLLSHSGTVSHPPCQATKNSEGASLGLADIGPPGHNVRPHVRGNTSPI